MEVGMGGMRGMPPSHRIDIKVWESGGAAGPVKSGSRTELKERQIERNNEEFFSSEQEQMLLLQRIFTLLV